MRISDSMIASTIAARLSAASSRLFRFQEQVASGLAFTTPSQDPAGAVRAAALRSGLAEVARYQDNARAADSQLRLAEVCLASISDRLLEARTTGLALDDTSPAGNEALADHAHEILSQIVRDISIASEGRYLFSGHKVLTAPLSENPGGSPPYLYEGDQGAMLFQLGRGVTVQANLNAAEVLNLGGIADPALDDVLDAIEKLETALRASDHEALADALASLDTHSNRVLALRAEIGARMQHIELAETQFEKTVLTFRDLLSEVRDVDITQAVIDLRSQEITYQAAAAAASALHRASLLDYMR